MISILMCDDHPVVREGLKHILSASKDIMMAGETGCCREALDKIEDESFDIILMDVNKPDENGLDLIKEMVRKKPDLPILVFSAYPEARYAVAVLKSGASGYLLKESLPTELVKAIREVSCGRKYISSNLAARLAIYLQSDEDMLPHEKLSSRELQVMCMIASGKRVSDIADELMISIKTVSTHRTRALEKMNMGSNVEFARYADSHGLVE